MLSSPYRTGVSAALVALAAMTPLCGCNISAGRRSFGGNDWIFPVLVVAGLAMGWISAYSDRRNILTLGQNATRGLGLSVFIIGCALRMGAMLVLGPRFSVWVAVQNGHRLETQGLYRFLRHPAYTGAMLTLVGWSLTFRSVIGILLAAAMVLPLMARMEAEETLLISEFGDEYVAYRDRTWRLIPLIY